MGRFFAARRKNVHHWLFRVISMMLAGAAAYAVFMNFQMSMITSSIGVVALVMAWAASWYTVQAAAAVMFLSIVALQAAAFSVYGMELAPLFTVLDGALLVLLWKKAKES